MPKDWRKVQEEREDFDIVDDIYRWEHQDSLAKNNCNECGESGHPTERCPYK